MALSIETPIAKITEVEEGIIQISMIGEKYTLEQCKEHIRLLKSELNADENHCWL